MGVWSGVCTSRIERLSSIGLLIVFHFHFCRSYVLVGKWPLYLFSSFFFLNDAPPPDIYPLPQHDPLPIFYTLPPVQVNQVMVPVTVKDESGQLVKGLLAKDFSVLENGKKQKLNFFTSDPFALSAAVI